MSLLIYPNIPKPADLKLMQTAVKKARIGRKGMWNKPESILLPYEVRWIVDTIGGGRQGPDRFCANITTSDLFPPGTVLSGNPRELTLFLSGGCWGGTKNGSKACNRVEGRRRVLLIVVSKVYSEAVKTVDQQRKRRIEE